MSKKQTKYPEVPPECRGCPVKAGVISALSAGNRVLNAVIDVLDKAEMTIAELQKENTASGTLITDLFARIVKVKRERDQLHRECNKNILAGLEQSKTIHHLRKELAAARHRIKELDGIATIARDRYGNAERELTVAVEANARLERERDEAFQNESALAIMQKSDAKRADAAARTITRLTSGAAVAAAVDRLLTEDENLGGLGHDDMRIAIQAALDVARKDQP